MVEDAEHAPMGRIAMQSSSLLQLCIFYGCFAHAGLVMSCDDADKSTYTSTARLAAWHLRIGPFIPNTGDISEVHGTLERAAQIGDAITWNASVSIVCGEGSASGVRHPDLEQHCAGRTPCY